VLPRLGRFVDKSLFSIHANSAHLNVNYRLLPSFPRVFRRGSGSGTEVEEYSAGIIRILQLSHHRVGNPLSPSWILFLITGWFFNLPLISHHCPCNLALVPRFSTLVIEIEHSAIGYSKLFGRLLARSGMNVNNVHARIYIPVRIRDTRSVPPLIS
jgi:hypothetical protein